MSNFVSKGYAVVCSIFDFGKTDIIKRSVTVFYDRRRFATSVQPFENAAIFAFSPFFQKIHS